MELKPCPFCGGDAKYRLKPYAQDGSFIQSARFIQCNVCLAQTRTEIVKNRVSNDQKQEYSFALEAIDLVDDRLADAWNRRGE